VTHWRIAIWVHEPGVSVLYVFICEKDLLGPIVSSLYHHLGWLFNSASVSPQGDWQRADWTQGW
jgi:hypothetical protein